MYTRAHASSNVDAVAAFAPYLNIRVIFPRHNKRKLYIKLSVLEKGVRNVYQRQDAVGNGNVGCRES